MQGREKRKGNIALNTTKITKILLYQAAVLLISASLHSDKKVFFPKKIADFRLKIPPGDSFHEHINLIFDVIKDMCNTFYSVEKDDILYSPSL